MPDYSKLSDAEMVALCEKVVSIFDPDWNGRYEHVVYGVAEVFDESTGQWRAPETPEEMDLIARLNENCRKSLEPI